MILESDGNCGIMNLGSRPVIFIGVSRRAAEMTCRKNVPIANMRQLLWAGKDGRVLGHVIVTRFMEWAATTRRDRAGWLQPTPFALCSYLKPSSWTRCEDVISPG